MKFSFFSVKDMHCGQVLTFLWSPIEWLTFCQNLSTCYYFLQKKLNFHFLNSPIFGYCRCSGIRWFSTKGSGWAWDISILWPIAKSLFCFQRVGYRLNVLVHCDAAVTARVRLLGGFHQAHLEPQWVTPCQRLRPPPAPPQKNLGGSFKLGNRQWPHPLLRAPLNHLGWIKLTLALTQNCDNRKSRLRSGPVWPRKVVLWSHSLLSANERKVLAIPTWKRPQKKNK